MGYIYIVRNNVNDKVYIGQTTYTIEKRFAFHVYAAYRETPKTNNSHFHNAIRKYGKEAFWFEEIEECEDDKLDEREIYWIQQYDSFRNGYNSTIGGEGGRKYSDEELLAAWNDGLSVSQIKKQYGANANNLSLRLRALGITKEEIRERASQSRCKKIYKYDLNGNFLEEYSSSKQVRKLYPQYCFTGAIDNPCKSVGGFMWRSYKIDHIEPYIDNHYRREVHQYSLDGSYIKTFRSVRAAAHEIGVKRESLRDALKRSTKQCGGYLWSYEILEMVA